MILSIGLPKTIISVAVIIPARQLPVVLSFPYYQSYCMSMTLCISMGSDLIGQIV